MLTISSSFGAGFAAAAFLLLALVLAAGCGSYGSALSRPTAAYVAALDGSRPGMTAAPEAVDRLIAMFNHYTEDELRRRVPAVYAEDAYFRDGFREVRGAAAIEEYLVHSAAPVRSCTFDFSDITGSNGEYFLRWVMKINLKRDNPERVSETIGVSHLRFNEAGKIVFHQDYWDPTDLLYSRIPVANWLIHQVRKKL